MSKRWMLGAAALGIGGLVVWLGLGGPGEDGGAHGDPSQASANTTPRAPQSAAARRAQVAAALGGRYTLGFETTLAPRGASGATKSLGAVAGGLQLSGVLELADSPNADGWLVGRVLEPVVSGDRALLVRSGFKGSGALEKDHTEFALRLGENGGVVEQRMGASLPEGARNALGTLLTAV